MSDKNSCNDVVNGRFGFPIKNLQKIVKFFENKGGNVSVNNFEIIKKCQQHLEFGKNRSANF